MLWRFVIQDYRWCAFDTIADVNSIVEAQDSLGKFSLRRLSSGNPVPWPLGEVQSAG